MSEEVLAARWPPARPGLETMAVDGIESVRDVDLWRGAMFTFVNDNLDEDPGPAMARMQCDRPMTEDEQVLWLRGRGPADMRKEMPW